MKIRHYGEEQFSTSMGRTEEWMSNVVDSTYRVSVWRSTKNLWDSLKKNLVLKVGEGNKVFFFGRTSGLDKSV